MGCRQQVRTLLAPAWYCPLILFACVPSSVLTKPLPSQMHLQLRELVPLVSPDHLRCSPLPRGEPPCSPHALTGRGSAPGPRLASEECLCPLVPRHVSSPGRALCTVAPKPHWPLHPALVWSEICQEECKLLSMTSWNATAAHPCWRPRTSVPCLHLSGQGRRMA